MWLIWLIFGSFTVCKSFGYLALESIYIAGCWGFCIRNLLMELDFKMLTGAKTTWFSNMKYYEIVTLNTFNDLYFIFIYINSWIICRHQKKMNILLSVTTLSINLITAFIYVKITFCFKNQLKVVVKSV